MASTKLVFALWGVRDLLDPGFTARCVAAGARRLQVNVSDAAVASAMLRLTTFDDPIQAVVSVWLPADRDPAAVIEAVGSAAARSAGWQVEERVLLELPALPVGERTPGLANIAFLRRPESQPYDEWLECWRTHHTPVAIETQATFGYVQNRVLAPATVGAPEIAAIVEEQFPIEALADPHAFYGSGGAPEELNRRIERMMRSVATFGADRDLDLIPTSRYRLH
ncbi:hypothetical protein [Nocardia sp. NPDC050710]|uniref:hypothetical protein n=1 Tax=Nocardia sp. NPDC050710 TaxID=3157220 RepID=UPI0033EAE55E